MNMNLSVGHSDIDSLVLEARDPESRRLIGEAITAYRGGASRSALISTWIAVAYDIIAKVRELAGQGEAAPRDFVKKLDTAIAKNELRQLQNIESRLLDSAYNDLDLLAPHEHMSLKRLQEDRNLCAHPAFVEEDQLFQPSPELVRSHIVHALQHLLTRAPLQGKSALDRFAADILGTVFPVKPEEISTYVRSRYLDRAKDVLIVNLVKTIIAAPFGEDRARFSGKVKVLATVLQEIANSKTAIYDSMMPKFVDKKIKQIHDDVLLSICPFLERDVRIWDWMDVSDRTRLKTTSRNR